MRDLDIDGTRIHDDGPCYVIAEMGHNHGGSVDRAMEMVEAAADCGCQAVKFQKRANRSLYTQRFYYQPYDNEHSFGATYGAHREALELSLDSCKDLLDLGREIPVTVFGTAFDQTSADQLMSLRVPAFKVASGDLDNTPLLTHIASFGLPMIVSTGGATWEDIDRAVNTIWPINKRLALLHCTAAYPVHDHRDLNLRAIPTMRDRYPEVTIGWSGHDTGIAMGVMAYVLGARIIEKHFTLNRTWRGTDQAFSLEPGGMKRLVRDLDRAREAWGDGDKRPLPCETLPLAKMRKCLVAARPLHAGDPIREGDFVIKSPGYGLPPYMATQVIGFPLAVDLDPDEPLTYSALKAGFHA